MRFSIYRADTICDRQTTDRRTDRQTDRQTDGRPGKNIMSPDPKGGGEDIIIQATVKYSDQTALIQRLD